MAHKLSSSEKLPAGTVTFLFTDIVGSTPLWESQPDQMAEALDIHNNALKSAIEAQGGMVFKIVGDAFQAAFPTAPQALFAAIAGQKVLQTASWNELGELKVRMGLHTGEAELDPDGDEYAVSHTKNRVARIMSSAHGGQILFSDETSKLVDHHLTDGVTLKDLGEHRLKGMNLPERLYQVCAPGLETDFPPLATQSRPKHNLPLQLTSFIGRDREIEEITSLLEKNRLVTLTGVGGTGKTRLSLKAAEAVLDAFPNGVWFAELAGLADPDLVPRTTVAALGLQESSSQSPLEQLKTFLHDRNLLIVLDNCEHVIADCARISQALLLTCPDLKILASSREALRVPGEIAYPVPSLPVPESFNADAPDTFAAYPAVQLFIDRASAVKPGFTIARQDAPSVVQVCRRLDGIPLAIELAAARVSALSVQQIAERLDNRFRLLTGGSRTAVPRQQTLRASIDWSYSLLPEAERLLLMRLSVFQGGWTLGLAEEVCAFDGLDVFDVLDGLASLVSKSLIIAGSMPDGETRYRRLETIGQYAREKLLDSGGSDAVHERHLEAFVHLAEQAEPHFRAHGQVEWLDRMELELDNFRAALEWAQEGEAIKGLRMVVALYWFWHIRAFRIEGERWLQQMQKRIDELAIVDQPDLVAIAQIRQAMLLRDIGRRGSRIDNLIRKAQERIIDLGEREKPIQALAMYALTLNSASIDENVKIRKECLQIAEELNDEFLISEVLLGDTETDPVKKKGFLERRLALKRELGDLEGLAQSQLGLGMIDMRLGDFSQAQMKLEEGVRTAKVVRSSGNIIIGLMVLGRLFYERGETEQAIQTFFEGLSFVQDLGEMVHINQFYNALGHTYGQKGDLLQAEGYFQQAIELAKEHQLTYPEAFSHFNLAEVAWSFDLDEFAHRCYQEAIDVSQGRDEHLLDGLAAYATGKKALICDNPALAWECFQAALNVYTGSGNEAGHCFESLAVCAARVGDQNRAARLHGIAVSRIWLKDATGMPWLLSYDLDELLAPAREALGEKEYARLLDEGKTMPIDEAVAYALEGYDE